VRAGCEINLVCGGNPEDATLKGIEDALLILRNSVVSHQNYRHSVPCGGGASNAPTTATFPNKAAAP